MADLGIGGLSRGDLFMTERREARIRVKRIDARLRHGRVERRLAVADEVDGFPHAAFAGAFLTSAWKSVQSKLVICPGVNL